MSSSRAMRKSSRMSSPFVTAPKDSSTSENDSHVQKEKEKASEPGEWSEPALRAPVPSFEDHKGLERHGVLEHMAPLGSLPSQKVKLRVKSHEAPRRMVQSKLAMDSNSGKDVAKAPLDTTVTTRRSESRKADDTIIDPTFDRDDDEDYKEKPVKQSRASKSKEPRPSVNSTPTSRTSAGQERLRQVVDSAVERAYELGTPILGLAVKKLFEESLQNRTLAELLDAVLSQRPTPRQALDFQAYIKIARKQIKIDNGMTRHSSVGGLASSSKSSSKSPVKSMRPANTGQSGTTPNDKSDRPASNTPTRTFPDTSRPPQHHSHPEASNGTMETNKERPAKRMKRSKSTSSSSSLSSLTSNEPDVDSDLPDPPSSARVGKSKAQASHSRKLPTKVSRKRLHVEVEPEVAPEELAKRRKKFERSFGDYRIPESDLRQSPRPVPRERSISVSPTFPSLAQPSSRLRNGTGRVAPASDHDNSHTQVSPGPGEQPPPGRSDTPNALGRPPKRIQKAARIKMS
ncbi:hypothetical protein MMC09_006156 [Bachmanniomyces sp. S44760]|nr:hypothetical protein [Bachmanniomyces sp. S44760]